MSSTPSYLPEPSFRDWAPRSGFCGCAKVTVLLCCLIQFRIHQTDPPTVRVELALVFWGDQPPHSMIWRDHSQKHHEASWLHLLGRTFLAGLALTHKSEMVPHRAAFPWHSVTSSATLDTCSFSHFFIHAFLHYAWFGSVPLVGQILKGVRQPLPWRISQSTLPVGPWPMRSEVSALSNSVQGKACVPQKGS